MSRHSGRVMWLKRRDEVAAQDRHQVRDFYNHPVVVLQHDEETNVVEFLTITSQPRPGRVLIRHAHKPSSPREVDVEMDGRKLRNQSFVKVEKSYIMHFDSLDGYSESKLHGKRYRLKDESHKYLKELLGSQPQVPLGG